MAIRIILLPLIIITPISCVFDIRKNLFEKKTVSMQMKIINKDSIIVKIPDPMPPSKEATSDIPPCDIAEASRNDSLP